MYFTTIVMLTEVITLSMQVYKNMEAQTASLEQVLPIPQQIPLTEVVDHILMQTMAGIVLIPMGLYTMKIVGHFGMDIGQTYFHCHIAMVVIAGVMVMGLKWEEVILMLQAVLHDS